MKEGFYNMIKVKEILNLSLFENFEILCGKEYLSNRVTAAVILEYESSRINYKGYCYGYFVLLSYFFATESPDIVHNALRTLIEKNVSAIAIKMLPEEHIPNDIIQLAEKNHVPLLVFHEEFMEDLIININESMKTRARYIVMEEKLNYLLFNQLSPEQVKETALQINENFKPMLFAVNITPKQKMDNVYLHSFFDHLMFRQYREEENTSDSFIKYKTGLILVCSFSEKEVAHMSQTMEQYIKDRLKRFGFKQEEFHVGYSKEIFPIQKLNISVRKAITSNIIGKFQKQAIKSYEDTGVYKYIASILRDPVLYIEIEKNINSLKQYDAEHDANLLETLIIYVKNNGDIKSSSAELFQHNNTIRYRIKKAQQLLNISDDAAYEEIALLIQSYLLHCTL